MNATPLLALASLLAGFAMAAPAAPRTAWQWEQTVEVAAPGITRLDLPPATIDASQPSFADLRLLSPDGVETPWLADSPRPPVITEVAADDFRATLDGRTTVLTASQRAGLIEAITLESPARGFLKSARIDGSNDGTTWTPMAAGEVIFRQADGSQRLRLPVSRNAWPHLRVTIDDARSAPVAFTGLQLTPVLERPKVTEQKASIVQRENSAGESRLVVSLGAKNLHLAEITLEVADALFSRACAVSIQLPAPEGLTAERKLASGTIYRVLGENRQSTANLVIPLHMQVAADNVVVTIHNGDSPPLEVHGVVVTRYPDHLLFFAARAGTWKLLTGNRQAAAPRYDLTPLRTELTRTPGNNLSPGPLVAKADYQAPPALPTVSPAGSGIDLTDWGRRRPLDAARPGVIRVDLDALTLAHCARGDLGDLRLIQNDKQVPWLLDSSQPPRALQTEITEDPDPKRPSVSRWKITLPVAGLPAISLTASSPDPLFSRDFAAIVSGKDELGNPWTRTVGGPAEWRQSPTDGTAGRGLALDLGNNRLPASFTLETENGDNPPIHLANVVVHHAAPALVAKLTDPAPVFLYYDNPHVNPPNYDLGMMRAELLAADKQTVTLGAEEELKASKRRSHGEASAGSPWLWAALGLVVVVLLLVVAKMLPKGTGGKSL